MDDHSRVNTERFAHAFDRFEDLMGDMEPGSIDDMKLITLRAYEMHTAQWAANLDIKTKHDLMKNSIGAIK